MRGAMGLGLREAERGCGKVSGDEGRGVTFAFI